MKAKLSVIVEELRGKAGSVVGKQSSQGQIMMMRSVGSDPKTSTQIRSRSLLIALSKKWKTLTQDDRNTWNQAAGSKRSGYDYFYEINANLNAINQQLTSAFPGTVNFNADVRVEYDINPNGQLFNANIKIFKDQPGTHILLKISQFTPRLLSKETYKLKNLIASIADINKTLNLYQPVLKVNKRIPSNEFYFLIESSLINDTTGQKKIVQIDTLQWTQYEQPYVPEAIITINQAKSEFNSRTDIGYITYNYVVPNFRSDKSATFRKKCLIYNDISMTSLFFEREYQDVIQLKENGIDEFGLDGGEFPDTWLSNQTKYVRIAMIIKVENTEFEYEYLSDTIAITAF